MKMEIKHAGFTLLELLIAMTLGVAMMIGLYRALEGAERIFNSQQQVVSLNHECRYAMGDIVRSIRQAGSGKKSLRGAPKIYYAAQSEIRLLSDLPHDVHGSGAWTDSSHPGPNGSSFDVADGPDADSPALAGNADDENENGDLILNDYDEDVTYMLSPNPCDSPPCRLIKREFSDTDPYPLETGNPSDSIPGVPVPDGAAAYPNPYDETIADNVMNLTFEYFADSTQRIDWQTGTNPLSIPANMLNKIKIVRVILIGQSKNRDRETRKFHTMQLSMDVVVRNQ
jgi:prepilin-type N-terminal cleavage/methylation domain-containing protein